MEAWSVFVDTVAGISDVLTRGGQKDAELSALADTVESISQSVQAFAAEIPIGEREAVFKSNKVFLQLLAQLQTCQEVLSKYRFSGGYPQAPQVQDVERPSSILQSMRRSLATGSRTLQEGLEVLGGKAGAFNRMLRLPEDQLAIIRQAAAELIRLVPVLHFAMAAHTARGQKRQHSEGNLGIMPVAKDRRTSFASTAGSCFEEDSRFEITSTRGPLAIHDAQARQDSILRLQLVSDAKEAKAFEFPALRVEDFRPTDRIPSSTSSALVTSTPSVPAFSSTYPASRFTSATTISTNNFSTNNFSTNNLGFTLSSFSTTTPPSEFSLTSTPSTDSNNDKIRRFVFGRQELKDKLPKNLILPVRTGAPPQPLFRFVSRDLFLVEVPTKAPADVQDSEACTMAFGTDEATLPMGDFGAGTLWSTGSLATQEEPPRVIAMTSNGLHVRGEKDTRWRWLSQHEKVSLHHGHQIALLLESPPGSCTPGPPKDLGTDEAKCLLGLELV